MVLLLYTCVCVTLVCVCMYICSGTYITENDVEERVQSMAETRQSMMERFERETTQYDKMMRGVHEAK